MGKKAFNFLLNVLRAFRDNEIEVDGELDLVIDILEEQE